MLAVDEVLSLGKVPPKIRVSKFVAAVDRSEGTLRNWLINPPRPPQKEFEESEKLLRVFDSEDREFCLPVSWAASQQIMQMRANMDERRYRVNRSSFKRIYEMDMELWLDVSRKQEGFEERDWDVVICCFYYQLNLAYCGDKRNPRVGLEDPEIWNALTQKLVHMADTGVQEAGSARREALYRLIKVSLLWRRIQHAWHWLSRKENPTEKERASDLEIFTQTRTYMARYGLFEETVTLSKELPDFVPLLFNAIATASGLREADRYAVLWVRLQRADERFSEAWFEIAYNNRGRGSQRTQPVFAANFERWVDEDFTDFIRWLEERRKSGQTLRDAG